MKVVVSPQALDDVLAIAAYIAQDDIGRARTYTDELRKACADLADFPRRYPRFLLGGANAHCRTYGNYLIVYTVTDQVDILTIVHGARDLDALF